MQELLAWMAANGVTQTALAASLGVTQGAVSQWMSAGVVPVRRAAQLNRLTGIPLDQLRPDVFGEVG